MEIISLDILLKDREYAEALARAIAASERYFLPMVLDRDQLHNFDEKEKVIIITDYNDLEMENAVYICSFMLPRTIVNAAAEKCSSIYGIRPHGFSLPRLSDEKYAKLIAVTSTAGGVGITSTADALAAEFTVYYDKSVCRMSLSAFPEGNSYSARELRRLLFMLCNSEEADIGEYFEKDAGGVYRACTGNGINPLLAAEGEEIYKLTAAVAEQGGFDVIIFDIPPEALKKAEKIIIASESVIAVEREHTLAARGERLQSYLELLLGKDAEKRVIRFVNFASAEYAGDFAAAEYDSESFCKDGVKIDGEFGLAVKNIAHSLIFC